MQRTTPAPRARLIRGAIVLSTVAMTALALEGAALAADAAQPSAQAGAKKTTHAKGAPAHDPNNVTSISEAMEAIAAGNAKLVANDAAAATADYQHAIELQPKNALAHYALGVARQAAGNQAEAEAEWKRAVELSVASPAIQARALYELASLYEREKKWDEAKAGWQRYVDLTSKQAAGAPAESGTARIQAIDGMQKQDKAYEVVRQRIAAEKAAAEAPKKK